MMKDRMHDIEKIYGVIGGNYEKRNACAVIGLAEGGQVSHILSGNAAIMLDTVIYLAGVILAKACDDPEDLLVMRMDLCGAIARESARRWQLEHRTPHHDAFGEEG